MVLHKCCIPCPSHSSVVDQIINRHPPIGCIHCPRTHINCSAGSTQIQSRQVKTQDGKLNAPGLIIYEMKLKSKPTLILSPMVLGSARFYIHQSFPDLSRSAGGAVGATELRVGARSTSGASRCKPYSGARRQGHPGCPVTVTAHPHFVRPCLCVL